MIDLMRLAWKSSTFERITYRVGAYLLLLSSLALPLGLHRRWMGLPGCWLFPLAFFLGTVGSFNFLSSFNHYWLGLVWPYPLLFMADAWIIWLTPVPSATTSNRMEG